MAYGLRVGPSGIDIYESDIFAGKVWIREGITQSHDRLDAPITEYEQEVKVEVKLGLDRWWVLKARYTRHWSQYRKPNDIEILECLRGLLERLEDPTVSLPFVAHMHPDGFKPDIRTNWLPDLNWQEVELVNVEESSFGEVGHEGQCYRKIGRS